MAAPRSAILEFWTSVDTAWADILRHPSIKMLMSRPQWNELGAKEQERRTRSLVSAETKAVAQILAARKVIEGSVVSYTELTWHVWRLKHRENDFNAKRVSVSRCAKTLCDFGLVEIRAAAGPFQTAAIVATEELLNFVDGMNGNFVKFASKFLNANAKKREL